MKKNSTNDLYDRVEDKKSEQKELQTLTNSYLMVDPNKLNGVIPRLYNYTDYNAFSRPTDDIDIASGMPAVPPTSLPNPITGIRIQLPDGDTTVTALGWAATGEQNSGWIRAGADDYQYLVNGTPVTEWLAGEFRVNYDSSTYASLLTDSVGDFYLKPNGAAILQRQGSNTTELWLDAPTTKQSILYLTAGLSVKWSLYRDTLGNNYDFRLDDDSDTRIRIYQATGNIGFGSSSEPLFWDNTNVRLTVDEAYFYTPGAGAGTRNLVIGNNSGNLTLTGSNNTVLGPQTAQALTTSVDGVFIGLQTGQLNQDGIDNTFVGSYAGAFNVSGNENAFFGWRAGYKNTASSNTFLGSHAGYENTTGQSMVGVGYGALEKSVTVSDQTGVGYQALNLSTADGNTALGKSAGATLTTGNRNTLIGANADSSSVSGQYRIAIGYGASAIANSTCYIGTATGGTAPVDLVIGGSTGYFSRANGTGLTAGASDDVQLLRQAANIWKVPGTGGRSLYIGDGIFTGYSGISLNTPGGTPTDFLLMGRTGSGDVYLNAPSSGSIDVCIGGTSNPAIQINSSKVVTANQQLRVGTATDTATQGDFVAGLTGAARMFYDQSAVQLQLYTSGGTQRVNITADSSTSCWLGAVFTSDAQYTGYTDRTPDTSSYFLLGRSAGSDRYVNAVSGGTMFLTIAGSEVAKYTASNFVVNDTQADIDFRIEGDSISHLFFTDATATTENIACFAAAAPNWQTMDRGFFIGDTSNAPTGNPTSGGFMYSNAGAGTWRGSGGTVTAFGPAGPHCGKCGYDFWTVASKNDRWGAYLYECGMCGKVYKKGPQSVLDKLTDDQKAEILN